MTMAHGVANGIGQALQAQMASQSCFGQGRFRDLGSVEIVHTADKLTMKTTNACRRARRRRQDQLVARMVKYRSRR
ncbi:hypothetical protein EUGRSUZ_C03410 [Eucalyptus grandis]|uniref:Uncharacterized protein n=2 Tax=Eucalyptus grandis TaxID=71139 RepID=A0ACC3LJ40_EUCGR|nr:hypothetical protein EUGRSUZ_C03410 [Eucalyptus grandis]